MLNDKRQSEGGTLTFIIFKIYYLLVKITSAPGGN